MAALQEQISERTSEPIVDVCGPQVVEQTLEVTKISILQGKVEQILDVLCLNCGAVGEIAEDRIRGRNPAADRGAHRWHSSSAGCEGTGGGFWGFSQGQESTVFSGADRWNSWCLTRWEGLWEASLRRNKLWTRAFSTSSTKLKWRNTSTRWPGTLRFHCCSLPTTSLASLSWRRDRFPSCRSLIRRSMSLLCWPCKLHWCRSWRRQFRPHSCCSGRKSTWFRESRRSRALRPLRVWTVRFRGFSWSCGWTPCVLINRTFLPRSMPTSSKSHVRLVCRTTRPWLQERSLLLRWQTTRLLYEMLCRISDLTPSLAIWAAQAAACTSSAHQDRQEKKKERRRRWKVEKERREAR